MTKKEKKLIIISALAGFFIVAVSYFYQLGVASSGDSQASVSDVSTSTSEESLSLGDPGSTHAHVSFVMLVDDDLYNFNRDKYFEQSEFVHFHEGNSVVIHKHAEGVSLPYFLETLGMTITDNCVILDEGDEYCEEDGKSWRMVVDGSIIEDSENYEIKHGDRILFDYSDDSDANLRVKGRVSVPEVPESLMEDFSNIQN